MSYVPDFAPDAESQWLELDIPLQECVLDEIEAIVSNPSQFPRAVFLHDFVPVTFGVRHYVFMRVAIDHSRQTVTILGVGHYVDTA